MADEDAGIREVVARHRDRFGRLDVLVNNAGVGIGAAAADHQTKFVDMQLDVNLRAIVLFYRGERCSTCCGRQETERSGSPSLAACSRHGRTSRRRRCPSIRP